ncbi:uncharacterized protein LOC110831714 isoform X6 [Zootermopsis nevadensis]|uniref:uncharacterized protein LOC110831714 isoform X6 n=1 Tax=Zootermopsis nevadensis TaxID=136037 RepID=UPI000B8E94A4|nr:uncharacterized protein LOC110831714 isoform X6 [Zootermopsis nevadensis]
MKWLRRTVKDRHCLNRVYIDDPFFFGLRKLLEYWESVFDVCVRDQAAPKTVSLIACLVWWCWKLFLVMPEIGRRGTGEELGGAGVAVAAAVAILEKHQEDQRRTRPPVVRRQQHGDLIPGAGVTSVNCVGETIARLQNRFSAGRSVGNSVSPSYTSSSVSRETKQDADIAGRDDYPSVWKNEQDNCDVKSNYVVTGHDQRFNDIHKSPSTKNISSLVCNNSVVSTLNKGSSTSLDTKTQSAQKLVSDCKVEIYFPPGSTQCLMNAAKRSSGKQHSLSESLSTGNDSHGSCDVQWSSSHPEAVDHHDGCDDYGDLGVSSMKNDTFQNDYQVQNVVKESASDRNIPPRRPRVICLRASASENVSRTKSDPELASEYVAQQRQLWDDAESASSSPSSGLGGVSEYLRQPSSVPQENEDHRGSPATGGSLSSGSSRRILASSESLGGDESSPDEEEDSTLKCSGTAWSGSDSAPRHRSSSTSEFSNSTSSEGEADDLDRPPHKPCRPSEDLTTTDCNEDFLWVHGSARGVESRRIHPVEKSNVMTEEKRGRDFCIPESDDNNHQELDYDPPQIMQNRNSMTPSYEKVTDKSEMQTSGNDRYEYHQLISESCETSHRKPPRHDSGLKVHTSFDNASSLDRRRHHGHNRASRDQKARSSIVLQSPRFRSPSRHVSPSAAECAHYSNTSCCSEAAKILMNHGVSCCDSATNLLRPSGSRESSHQHLYPSPCSDPAHCCLSTSVHEDVMSSSYDSSFSDNRHHHHHHGDLQCYGSAGKLDCHSRMCHGLGSEQCCSMLPQGGDCYGSHGYLPLCNCQAEQRCRRRHVCKQPPVNFDVEERLRRLEADKDSLQLQVTVLTEQIEVQTDKISDLEKLLEEKKMQLANAEDVLQREMLSRSSSETQKLELLSAMSELKLHQAALERDNLELRDRLGEERRRNKPPVIPRSALLATSTPVSSQQASQLLGGGSPSPSPVSSLSEGSPRRLGNHPNSVEDFKDIPAPRTPPANYRRKVEHYGSLPRQRITTNGTAVSPLDGITPTANSAGMRKGVAFGKGLVSSFLPFQHPHHHASRLKVSGPDKSFSTPNLAETERVVIDDVPASPSAEVLAEEEVDETTGSLGLSPQPSPSFQSNRGKGIKKIFGRVKRSGSGNLDDVPGEGEFRRGGVRATAGPRLGWTNQPFIKQKSGECCRPDQPFAEWDSEAISGWLQELGLDCYAGDTKRWVKSGAQLLQASNHELEKELGIKNPIHRKKLHLALLSQQEAVLTLDPYLIPAGELDTAWVLRWLDDAGLPQHKETFLAARVDGRVLHRLTMDELAILHVTSHLHIASLRRGIQVLRNNKFEPNCLKRRSLPDDPSQPTAQDVALWTNHRVMEWLRIVDLAEYAPNLRGSGVHGGLMVHEPRFTAELMASLLSIPPSKTLLRRHLNTHFKELLGRDCIQEKREAEATLGYVPLSATTKVKVTKKSQFILKRKKSRSELDFGDLVCPLDPNKSGETLPPGDGMTQTEARHPRAVAACREAAISSPVDRLISECKFPERTSDV